MRIQGPNRLGGVSSGSSTKRTDGSGFALPSEPEGGAPKTATATATHALAGLDALIALQAVDADAPRKKRKAVKRGRDLLDRLDEIRIGLLSGQLSGEAIARIELRDDGFSLRLPGYRGYFPSWPIQRLEGEWSDVTRLARRRVHAGILGIRFDYIAHRVTTGNGSIVLFEPLPNDFSRNTRGAGLNLPVHEIAAAFSSRTGCPVRDEGEIQGGGLWRNLAYGGPDLS